MIQSPYCAPYTRPTRQPYAFAAGDVPFACFCLALGFLCWEWQLGAVFSNFLILMIALIGTAVYLRARGLRQTRRSACALAVCILGALPFLLYDATPLGPLLLLFDLFACLYWVCVTAGASVEARLSGFVLTDWANQVFAVPLSNFLGFFAGIKSASKNTKRGKSVLIGAAGLCVAIPIIIGVTSLLIRADSGFERFADDFSKWASLDDIGVYLLELLGGIPIACYIFGAVYGNSHGRYTALLTKESAEQGLARAHRIPRPAILAPLAALCAIYILFMAVMGVYLFSAFAGELPDGFTYAEYARKGFFELCGVAAINLFILAFAYSFAKREAGEYPKGLRLLTGLLCVTTELLVATALSKMLLYIGAYDLSRLRVYVLWFLVLLFACFAILIVWHIRPFDAGRPITVAAVCLFLALVLANTDGLIAKYNVWQYENGHTKSIDFSMLSGLSDAALPYLDDLANNTRSEHILNSAAHEYIRKSVGEGLETRPRYYQRGMLSGDGDRFRRWNIQSAMAQKYLPD
ncbi:MAG: DUF4173 domain-containing protein [Clostridiales Family XIII bacterium]|jgi:hypothetical protein|nr:DUF4173 domain-containing protein [Clostridiales Family XIII bacterium]